LPLSFLNIALLLLLLRFISSIPLASLLQAIAAWQHQVAFTACFSALGYTFTNKVLRRRGIITMLILLDFKLMLHKVKARVKVIW
jgi:hypothetical protein